MGERVEVKVLDRRMSRLYYHFLYYQPASQPASQRVGKSQDSVLGSAIPLHHILSLDVQGGGGGNRIIPV